MILQSIPTLKYPRTPHLEGSRLQPGDDSSDQVPLKHLAGRFVVIEEKLDGANVGISFSPDYQLLLQSRGHYLAGGGRERQFNLFKRWAQAHEGALLNALEDRYVLYGEWTYAKHSVWYDQLPHFLHEFDIWDRRESCFLSTERRAHLLKDVPVLPVPVLYAGEMPTDPKLLWKLVRHSLAKSQAWKTQFEAAVLREGHDLARSWKQSDKADAAEGLYLKVEEHGQVLARYKLVRPDFVQTILDSESHHSERPILPNKLHPAADLYSPQLAVTWETLGLRTLTSLSDIKELS